jgi:hypothetical protein
LSLLPLLLPLPVFLLSFRSAAEESAVVFALAFLVVIPKANLLLPSSLPSPHNQTASGPLGPLARRNTVIDT